MAALLTTLRSSSFSPLSIPGLLAWYDFSDISSLWKDTGRTSAVTADADIVLGVTDKSGQATHLSEATNGPTYKTSIQNGRSVLRFDGSNDQLTTTTFSTVAGAITFVATFAKRSTAVAGSNRDLIAGVTGSVPTLYAKVGTPATYGYYRGALQEPATSFDTSWHQVDATYNGASSSLVLDGTTISSGNPGTNTSDTAFRIAKGNGDFDFGEVLVVAGTVASMTSLRSYLKTRWGTP